VCLIASARRRDPGWAAVAGLAVAAVAILVSGLAGLPSEPGPAMALGLSVLVGSAIRSLPALPACAVAAGGLAVAAGSLPTAHTSSVVALNGAGWLAAVAVGGGLRLLAARRRAEAERVRHDERLQLARELHDVVAHHVTGIVLQAQAARLLARKRPEQVDDSLADIEDASTGALAAMRRVVGLLRDTAPAACESLYDLVERFDGPAVSLRLPDDEESWPPEVALPLREHG
jgi:signal transduction histidine kinase